MYTKYFQKSKIFLYPLLDIKKGNYYVPIETFLTWNGQYKLKDKLFFCLYNQKESKKWNEFKNMFLLKNPLFYKYINLDENLHLYIFDIKEYASDYNYLCEGHYSKFSNKVKDKIINFFGEKGTLAKYIEEYLYPKFYHKQYAEDLNVNIDEIITVWELCDKPDFKKEELNYKKPDKKLNLNNKLLSLYTKSKNIL